MNPDRQSHQEVWGARKKNLDVDVLSLRIVDEPPPSRDLFVAQSYHKLISQVKEEDRIDPLHPILNHQQLRNQDGELFPANRIHTEQTYLRPSYSLSHQNHSRQFLPIRIIENPYPVPDS